jgi:hypothetical protein
MGVAPIGSLLVKHAAGAGDTMPVLRSAVASLDASLPVFKRHDARCGHEHHARPGSGRRDAVGTVLTSAAWAACYVPALRASRIEPIAALRDE